jgi:UDP-N-acetylglucosamine 2-epimerase (non-hydrolysing)
MDFNILVVMGTRPEIIKLYPVIKELKRHLDPANIKICFTGQHNEMAVGLLKYFRIEPDYSLNVMRHRQSLNRLSGRLFIKIDKIMSSCQPQWVIAQGDTTSVWTSAVAAFHKKIQFAHVEAGLRTNDVNHPFPEEINRVITAKVATLHFSPTPRARHNLISEGINRETIKVVGNTVVDTLLSTLKRLSKHYAEFSFLKSDKKTIVLTLHRRENHGDVIDAACQAILELSQRHDNIQIVFPVHYNPEVRRQVLKQINTKSSHANDIYVINPPDYEQFVYLLNSCWLIVTDSGGIQEEAPTLSKPVLILRETTERPECVEIGAAKLIGKSYNEIVDNISHLLYSDTAYQSMCNKTNPFGDGSASKRIVTHLLNRHEARNECGVEVFKQKS